MSGQNQKAPYKFFCLGRNYCPYTIECHCNHMVSITNELWPECLRSVLTDIRSEFSFSQISKALFILNSGQFFDLSADLKGLCSKGKTQTSAWNTPQSGQNIFFMTMKQFPNHIAFCCRAFWNCTVYPSIMVFNFCLKTCVMLFQDGLNTLPIDSIMLGLLN